MTTALAARLMFWGILLFTIIIVVTGIIVFLNGNDDRTLRDKSGMIKSIIGLVLVIGGIIFGSLNILTSGCYKYTDQDFDTAEIADRLDLKVVYDDCSQPYIEHRTCLWVDGFTYHIPDPNSPGYVIADCQRNKKSN